MEYVGEVVLKRSSEKKVRNFYLWIYSDDIKKLKVDGKSEGLVNVLCEDGKFLCIGFYSKDSKKPIRVLSYSKEFDVQMEIKKRLLFSLDLRKRLVSSGLISSDNFRVVYSESDFLPGLIIDKYGDFAGIQIRNRLFEELYIDVINSIDTFLGLSRIYERSYGEFREDEDLPPRNIPVKGSIPSLIRIYEDGLQFVFDPFKGQKTGFFLDQAINRRIVGNMCNSGMRVLDVFSYVGGFAIHCAKRGAKVVAIEKNENYSNLIEENARLNNLRDNVKVVCGDAFKVIKEIDGSFDIIILDPPTLVKSLSESRRRLPILIELIKDSLRLLKPDGKLVVFTCSYNLLKEHFVASIRIAGMEAGYRIRIEQELLQSPDHPWILQMPETLYLKGFVISKLASF